MTQQDNPKSAERRRHERWSVYSFMHATATLLDSAATEQIPQNPPALYWTGLLVDISHEGAQVTLPSHCVKYFKQEQRIKMQIKTTVKGLSTEVTAQIKSIEVIEYHDNVRIRVRFTNMENNKEAQNVIAEICEYGRKFKAESEAHANETISSED